MSYLPANVLLDIFHLCRIYHDDIFQPVWEWHILVHVCRRWRQIIFDSPLHLDLQIPCTYGTPVKKCGIGIWPNLPISVHYCYPLVSYAPPVDENMICALGYPDRVAHLGLIVTDVHLHKLAAVIQKPFPVLRHLILCSLRNPPLLPADFLGGSVPRLQRIDLRNVAFPALPALLLSASDLVELKLNDIPPTSYISPVVMVTCLAKLPRLKTLFIQFTEESTTLHPNQILPPSITRSALPALTHFQYKGISKYLEDLTARIVCLRLFSINIDYFDPSVDLQAVQLSKFFDLSLGPEIFRRAKACFKNHNVTFDLNRPTDHASRLPTAVISCQLMSWRPDHALQVVNAFSVILSSVVHVRLAARSSYLSCSADDLEWLHFLHRISTVQTLYISWQLAARIATALKSFTGEMVAEALPSLDLICLEGQPTSSIEKFIAVRKLSGRPVTAISTEEGFNRILYSRNGEDDR